ncbi:Retrotransposon gag domain [Sesbania bispinosa]|nr:Retrotransposon gag domain [Sesbania bispinosa]
MKLKPTIFSESNASEDPQCFIDGLERLWRALGCSDIRVVELASFQLEGVAYDWFDTVKCGTLVGSPLLAWGEFSRLFIASFLLDNVRDGLAHEFERLEQTKSMSLSEYSARLTQHSKHDPYPITEEMHVKRFVRGDIRRKEVVVGILARNKGLRDHSVVTPVLVWDLCPIIRQFGSSSGQGYGVAKQSGRAYGGRGHRQGERLQLWLLQLEKFYKLILSIVHVWHGLVGSHYATLDCHNKVVKVEMLGESAFSFQGDQGWASDNLI